MSRLLLVPCILVLAARLHAAPTQWSVAEGGNGHWYEPVLVSAGITWNDANSAATAAGGYLVSITSSAENALAFSLISDNLAFWLFAPESLHMEGPWLGGFQAPGSAEPSGGWRWTSSELWGYSNWGPGEPSNGGGLEDRLQFFGYDSRPMSYWNDYAGNGVVRYGGITVLPHGYIVEYDAVPEPSSLLALLCGIGGLTGPVYLRSRRP